MPSSYTFLNSAMGWKLASSPTTSKIYPTNDAKRNAYPFTVYILYRSSDGLKHWCSGSLIKRQWVLTAAHCLVGTTIQVVLGAYDRSKNETTTQTIDVAEEIISPDYEDRTYSSDVGLIRLAKRANIRSEAVELVTLLSSESKKAKFLTNTKMCKVVGWGNMKFENGWRVAEKLQEQEIRWVTPEEAASRGYFQTSGSLASETVYEDECNKGSVCGGDSGGPYVCKQGGKWIQVGITSYGDARDGCITGIKFAADVQAHFDWISSVAGLTQ